jgi:hypothetical protein
MKTKKPFLRLVALSALSLITGNELVAQTNIGAACGCPSFASREEVVITAAPGSTWVTLPAGAYGKELLGNQNVVLTCNKTWMLNEKLYIGPGSTLTIEPGTVIKGGVAGSAAAATALIIERGGKIIAPGVEDCPIVFTAAADPLTGTYGVNNKGMWGGVLICGKATNNLTLALNGPFVPGASGKLAAADGLGVLEGFASSYPQDQFGVTLGSVPFGYVSATSPTGSYSFSGTPTSSQNTGGQTALVTTATIPGHLLTYITGKPIAGTGIPLGATVLGAATTTITLSANATTSFTGTYTIGATQATAAGTGNTAGTTLTLALANTEIVNGMIVTGTGIAANTTVSGVSGTAITLSATSTATMAGTYTFTTPGASSAGSGSTASAALTLSGTTTGTIVAGMTVSGTGIAAGTTVTAITGTAVTLSANSTAAMTGTYTFGNPTFTATDAFNGLGSTKVKLTAALPLLVAGVVVTGPGIPTGTTLASISGTTLTLSAAATAPVTAVTFAQQYPNPGTTAFFPISGAKSAGSGLTGSTALNLSGSTFGTAIVAGMPVSGTGIAPGTTVQSITGTAVTLSQASTAEMSGNYYFTGATTAPAGLAVNGTEYVNFAALSISAAGEQFNDNDNSGVMTYVSIRHSGANLLVGSEINGLTLASVGRGTKIEHVEIVSCADDNIELFGGTVDLKYCTTLYGNDDMYDYDLGWSGKAQFLFGMKADNAGTPHVSQDNDNGFEADGGDNNQTITQSNPTIYNATILGNAKTQGTADNRALAAMNFKEGAKGTLNNSVFAHFKNGLNVENGLAGEMTANAYHNWATTATATAGSLSSNNSQTLKVKCNTFIGVTNPMTLNASTISAAGQTANTAANTANTTQWTDDKNLSLNQAEGETAGFKYAFAINGTTNAITTKNDVVPNTGVAAFQLGTGCAQAPMDGFFSPANYRGAFAPSANNENWLSNWTYSQVLNSTNGVTACPTDLNSDGVTNVADFLIFAPKFGSNCN